MVDRLEHRVPVDKAGRKLWGKLARTPDIFIDVLNAEITTFLSENGILSKPALEEAGRSDLTHAIYRYYPGGLTSLMKERGIEPLNKPSGFWMDPDNVKGEARKFLNEEGKITSQADFKVVLGNATRTYPGGVRQLKKDLDLVPNSKPDRWNAEVVRQQAASFYAESGELSFSALTTAGRTDMIHAISRHYKGGFSQLRVDLGIKNQRRATNYWTTENMENEARKIVQETGGLAYKDIKNTKRGGFGTMVISRYPGGISGLRAAVGVTVDRKSNNYWTPETIEEEAREFLEKFGSLSSPVLKSNDRADLLAAIFQKYPGQIKGIQERLGIASSELTISPDEANKQLRRLLEEQ